MDRVFQVLICFKFCQGQWVRDRDNQFKLTVKIYTLFIFMDVDAPSPALAVTW